MSKRSISGWSGRWVLYVAFAFVGALLTFVGARAQQKASDDRIFRKLTDEYCTAWSSGNPDLAARFYAQEPGRVFYDLTPFAYHSWKEYHDGVQKEFFDNASEARLTAGKDLQVSRRGNLAWTTVSMHLYDKSKDGKVTEAEVRYTGIWERRAGKWVLVHEHLSAPMNI
jgi:ketosteroid isomerase-like protein